MYEKKLRQGHPWLRERSMRSFSTVVERRNLGTGALMAGIREPTGKCRSRGEVEAEMAQAMVNFEKEYLGRGPVDTRAFFINNMILIRLRGVLTPAERKVAEIREGQSLVKENRRQLFESSRATIEALVWKIVGCQVVSLHTDVSTKTGERVIVLTVDANLDEAEHLS
jgi:uncharacterized protein YbcI